MEHILDILSSKMNDGNFMYQLGIKQNLNKNLCSDCTLKNRSPEMVISLRKAGNIEYSDNTVNLTL